MVTARNVVAVIVAGLVGLVVNAAFIGGLMEVQGLGFEGALELALKPGRYAVAILAAAALPFAARLSGAKAWAVALVALTAAPTLLTLLVLNPAAPWIWVVAANLVYAGAATATYALIARRRR